MAEFITDVFLLTGKDGDSETTVIDSTYQKQEANLFDSSWRNKAKRFLAYKRSLNDEYVVTDILVVPEDKDVPDDYAGCYLTKDTREKGLRKHILCYKRDLRTSVEKAITDIKVLAKGESLPANYSSSISTNLNENQIIFKIDNIKRRSPSRQAPPIPQVSSMQKENNIQPLSLGSPVTDLDGVPFEINPRYCTNKMDNPSIYNLYTITLDDIYRRYDYSFEKEKSVIRYAEEENRHSNSFEGFR